MELTFNLDNANITFDLNKNIIFFGANTPYKLNLINQLHKSLQQKGHCLINGATILPNEYNIIYIDEETDLENEFKFTKNNYLKQMIYDDILKKVNEEKLLSYTNEIFDTIDKKVNHLLNRKINNHSESCLSFQIEIPTINSIIDKFTNIYIDNLLLSDTAISKSIKRKLLYQLLFLNISQQTDKINIIIINNFDAYLNANETIELLNTIEKISNENCHFILSSSSNIFPYINLEYYRIYKIHSRITPLKAIDMAIRNYILRKEFKEQENMEFETFKKQFENLILETDVTQIRNNIFSKYAYDMSNILNASSIDIITKKPKRITNNYILCENKDLQLLFEEITNIFID